MQHDPVWFAGGYIGGGTKVVITLHNMNPLMDGFDASAVSVPAACMFGETEVTASYAAPSTVTCDSPVMEPGKAALSVSLNGQDYSANIGSFTFMNMNIAHPEPSNSTSYTSWFGQMP
eukprot:scaffold111690_cov50-Prasinocladus_malaysianus.AAC.1